MYTESKTFSEENKGISPLQATCSSQLFGDDQLMDIAEVWFGPINLSYIQVPMIAWINY